MTVAPITSVGSSPATSAIRNAAKATGASFEYLLATAKVESGLDPALTTRSSTATGLFQFIDQTWLAILKQSGAAFGYARYADAISRAASGHYVVDNPALRNEIMQLRKDVAANALMGGALTRQNAKVLSGRLGREPSESELYMAHFLGGGGAAKAIAAASNQPNADAARIFPAAARANRDIFYDRLGLPRSVAEVRAELARRYAAARAGIDPASAATLAGAVAPSQAAAPTTTGAVIGAVTVTAAMPAIEAQPAEPRGPAQRSAVMFHSLFQTGERREAVSPAVNALWGIAGKTSPGEW